MKTVTVFTKDGSEAGTVELPDEIFGIEPSSIAIYQVVRRTLQTGVRATPPQKREAR